MSMGTLQVIVTAYDTDEPISSAVVVFYDTGNPDSPIEQLRTDANGQTDVVELTAPPVEYSLEPGIEQPFSEYNIIVNAPGFNSISIDSIEIFAGELSLLPVRLTRTSPATADSAIVIPAHTLWGTFPPKIAESEIKDVTAPGEIVLSKVVLPETIIVHDGPPSDSSARNYYVRYADYIKNVASSEVYSTWPASTLRANILAIMSFTLNRVYTEWYRNQGYNFTITSSTAFDHKWIYGRNIYESISTIVDELFPNYLSRPNVKQPILTQYCDGRRVSCPNWLSQWGSKDLGDQGYSAIQILRYYYGDNMYINTAEEIQGIPASWPGENIDIGSSGPLVRQLQEELNLIGEFYNAIPALIPDGIYGERTADAVRAFQKIFKLGQSGIVDYPTWYKISDRYVRLSGIAELQ